MLNKILASVGIGSATVNARIAPATYLPGGQIAGDILIQGGSTEQEIRGVYLRVMTSYVVESDDHKYNQDFVLTEFRIPETFVLRAGEQRIFDFTLVLPPATPVTSQKQRVWLKTGLDIANAVDSGDSDPLMVAPTPLMQRVMDGMAHLGFYLRDSRCEKGRGGHVPFVQEFEFVPQGGFYRGRVDEVDVMFQNHGGATDVLLEVDRKARGLAGLFEAALDMDERRVRLHFSDADAQRGPDYFADHLHRAMSMHVR